VKLTTHLYLAPRLKKRGAVPALSHYVFMEWYLIKHSKNFTFNFTLKYMTRYRGLFRRIPEHFK